MKRRTFLASTLAGTVASLIGGYRSAAAGADVPALTGTGTQIVIPGVDVDDLRAGLRGQLLSAGQAGYDEARRIWNGAFDRKPALIARVAPGAPCT